MYLHYDKRSFGLGKYHLMVNAAHVAVTDKTGRELYSRHPRRDDWLDASHKRIYRALCELEDALTAAVETSA